MAEEISKIRCGTNGECHDIKDARARESIASIENTIGLLENIIKGITGGDIDEYVTEEEIAAIINDVNTNITTAATAAKEEANNTTQTKIAAEAAARANADTTLQSNIDAEAAARAGTDSTLQSNIDAEATARANADSTLQSNIDAEAAARANGDTTLQNNLNNFVTVTENTNGKAYKFANGLLICTGRIASKSGNVAITLPSPFVNTNYVVTWGCERNSSTNQTFRVMSAHDKQTTLFYSYCLNDLEKVYTAVGMWK